MSDTPANQKHYPQHSNQLVGCGFPLFKIGGVVLGDNRSSIGGGDSRLYQSVNGKWHGLLYATLQPDDVVVADSAYGTYVDLALVRSANADAVFRKHHARHCDFRVLQEVGHWRS